MTKTSFISPFFCFVFCLFGSCSNEQKEDSISNTHNQQIKELSTALTEAEKNDDMKGFLQHYDENAISMPEYQPTLTGIQDIEDFYKEIFRRQEIKTFQRNADEIIHLGKTVIEIGTFKKEYVGLNSDTLVTQHGKYWNIWDVSSNGNLKLKGEVFGFFHDVKNPATLTVQLKNVRSENLDIYSDNEIPLELKAYNALDEHYVRTRAGTLKSDFYTSDGKFMPFANPTITGTEELKPYFIEYSSRGEVTIDSIAVKTFYYEYFDDYVMEYAKFKVRWSASTHVGGAEGKGIRLWKRQQDKSLRRFRHIGTHNYLE